MIPWEEGIPRPEATGARNVNFSNLRRSPQTALKPLPVLQRGGAAVMFQLYIRNFPASPSRTKTSIDFQSVPRAYPHFPNIALAS